MSRETTSSFAFVTGVALGAVFMALLIPDAPPPLQCPVEVVTVQARGELARPHSGLQVRVDL